MLLDLHKKYIDGTGLEAPIFVTTVRICTITAETARGLRKYIADVEKPCDIYMSTKSLKHMYDKRPAEEYFSIIKVLPEIMRRPEHVYENKVEKSASLLFVTKVENGTIICALQKRSGDRCSFHVVSAFRAREKKVAKYLSHCKLTWSWGSDISPS